MALFDQKAPSIMAGLMRDLALTDFQAGGVLGNIGHECAGFVSLHQIGGNAIGWVQWDGVRKVAYSAWCAKNGLDWRSDEANYRYLVLELKGSELAALNALKASPTLEGATYSFEQKFERAGVPALASRLDWARKAMTAYLAAPKPIAAILAQPQTHDQPVIVPAEPLKPKPVPLPPRPPVPTQPQPAKSSGFFDALAKLFAAIVAAIFPKG